MQRFVTELHVPFEGTNKLTEYLKAHGADPADIDSWPDDVYSPDGQNFAYKADLKYRVWMLWESPCGLQTTDPGQWWGDTWIDGEFKCAENGNPLFECPWPGKHCPHKKKLPAGINCQFHWCDGPYDREKDIAFLQKKREKQLHEVWERLYETHPGFYRCSNEKAVQQEDGSWKYAYPWNLDICVSTHCQNTTCPARGWASRDISPANIFFDIAIERRYEDELIPRVEKSIIKGKKVFDKPIARTDAEFALKIWEKNPYYLRLPIQMQSRMNPWSSLERNEKYFIEHHGVYNGQRYSIYSRIERAYVERFEQRDMLADLQAVAEGAEVIHESDQIKASAAEKKARRQSAKIEKAARNLAKGNRMVLWPYASDKHDSEGTRKRKQDMREAIKKRAAEIKAKAEEKEKRKIGQGEQVSMF